MRRWLCLLLLAGCAPAPDSGLLNVCVAPCQPGGGPLAVQVDLRGHVSCYCLDGTMALVPDHE